jgi:uncharacterized tellurite resistance protein B-like protein
MFERLRELLGERADLFGRVVAETDDRRWAAASLLVVAARMDAVFDPRERQAISGLLRSRFGLTDAEARELMAAAENRAEQSQQIFPLTRIVEESFTPAERIELVEMLWEVIYADGRLDAYEANLMRRIAGLIHVSDGESGAARKRVLERLGRA